MSAFFFFVFLLSLRTPGQYEITLASIKSADGRIRTVENWRECDHSANSATATVNPSDILVYCQDTCWPVSQSTMSRMPMTATKEQRSS